MKIFDRQIENLIDLAENEIFSGNYEKASNMLQGGLYDEPGYPKLHYTMGWMNHYYVENPAKAERHYNLTIHFDEEYEDAYQYLVDLYFKYKMYNKILKLMTKAQTVEKVEKQFVFETMGKVFERKALYSHAIKYYRSALVYCMDNKESKDLKQTIKRTKFKKLRKRMEKWQLKN